MSGGLPLDQVIVEELLQTRRDHEFVGCDDIEGGRN
jgi:hypothetical protein